MHLAYGNILLTVLWAVVCSLGWVESQSRKEVNNPVSNILSSYCEPLSIINQKEKHTSEKSLNLQSKLFCLYSWRWQSKYIINSTTCNAPEIMGRCGLSPDQWPTPSISMPDSAKDNSVAITSIRNVLERLIITNCSCKQPALSSLCSETRIQMASNHPGIRFCSVARPCLHPAHRMEYIKET